MTTATESTSTAHVHFPTQAAPYARIEVVTPEKAARWLKKNTHNRDLRQKRVKALEGAIARGEWRLNGDAIVFSGDGEDGYLANGQHRLYAIVAAGISVTCLVLYNAEHDAQETMDSGMARTLGQKLKLRNEKYYNEIAASLRAGWCYDEVGIPDQRFTALRPTDAQLIQYLETYPEVREAPATGNAARRAFISPAGSWPGLVFLFRRSVGNEIADRFLNSLLSGVGLVEKDPILMLRQHLIRQQALPSERRLGTLVIAAHVVKAFNAHCLGQQMALLRWESVRETFPTIITKADIEA